MGGKRFEPLQQARRQFLGHTISLSAGLAGALLGACLPRRLRAPARPEPPSRRRVAHKKQRHPRQSTPRKDPTRVVIPLFHVKDGPYDYLVVYAKDRRFRAHLQSPHIALLVLGILRRWAARTPAETPATGGIPDVLRLMSKRLGSMFNRDSGEDTRSAARQATAPGTGVRRAIARALVKDYYHYYSRRTQQPKVGLLPSDADWDDPLWRSVFAPRPGRDDTARSPGFPPSPSW